MIHLDLSLEEQLILAETLDCCLSELHTEITHTDNRDYKQMLLHRKAVLLKIQQALSQVQPQLLEASEN